jgi:hypothetical protein
VVRQLLFTDLVAYAQPTGIEEEFI